MLAALTTHKKREIVLNRVNIPVPHENEVLLEVSYCGICGSDIHAYNHAKGYEFVQHPMILGHEISGTVVQVGSENLKSLIGQRVIVESMSYCGECENCKQKRYSICSNNQVIGLHDHGGMAEYVKVNAKYIVETQNLPMDIAVLGEPMAIAVHALKRLERSLSKDDVVLVQGAGIIGFFVSLLCVDQGAKVYISGLEKDYEHRLSKFESFNMIPTIVGKDFPDEKVNIVFECSGSTLAFNQSFSQLKKGGEVIVVALYEKETDIFMTDLVRNEWSMLTSYGSDPDDYKEALKILDKYQIKLREMISYFPLENVEEAFTKSFNQKVLKAVLKMK